MTRFENQNLTDSEFRECDLTRARMIGVIMADATIDGLVGNLVINGVEVSAYVEAELAPGTGAGADPIGRSD